MSWSRESIFDSSVLRKQLGGKVGVGNVLIMGWEGVSLKTERTYPQLSTDVDLTLQVISIRLAGGLKGTTGLTNTDSESPDKFLYK